MALKIGVMLGNETGNTGHVTEWSTLADKVEANFLTRFWDSSTLRMADKISAAIILQSYLDKQKNQR